MSKRNNVRFNVGKQLEASNPALFNEIAAGLVRPLTDEERVRRTMDSLIECAAHLKSGAPEAIAHCYLDLFDPLDPEASEYDPVQYARLSTMLDIVCLVSVRDYWESAGECDHLHYFGCVALKGSI